MTRGLLALANREDEVAGVLAHEMAHVIERHAGAAGRCGDAAGRALRRAQRHLGHGQPDTRRHCRRDRPSFAGLTLAPYSREQEREADRIGAPSRRARAGTPADSVSSSACSSGPRLCGNRHPGTPELLRHPSVDTRAHGYHRGAGPIRPAPPRRRWPRKRPAFLGRIEGLVIGDNAAHGVFVGPLFLHADLDLALEMPAGGWKTANNPGAAGAVAPEQAAAVLLQVVGSGSDPVAGAQADGLTESQIAKLRRFQISGLPAADLAATTRDRMYVDLTWIAHGGRIFRVTGVCHETDRARYRPIFEQTAATFRALRPGETGPGSSRAASASVRRVPGRPWRRSCPEAAPRGPLPWPRSPTGCRRPEAGGGLAPEGLRHRTLSASARPPTGLAVAPAASRSGLGTVSSVVEKLFATER